jgi:hypothetical protein
VLEAVIHHVLDAIKFNPQWASIEQAKQNQVAARSAWGCLQHDLHQEYAVHAVGDCPG